jgi:hypothetical protein
LDSPIRFDRDGPVAIQLELVCPNHGPSGKVLAGKSSIGSTNAALITRTFNRKYPAIVEGLAALPDETVILFALALSNFLGVLRL